MWCLKSFGERIAARDPDRQAAEIQFRVAPINCLNALGTAKIVRVACCCRGKWQSCIRRQFCNNAVAISQNNY